MPLEVIYVTRHGSRAQQFRGVEPPLWQSSKRSPPKLSTLQRFNGAEAKLIRGVQFRSNWVVDPNSGEYQAHLRSPTGIASDPALTSHGVDQAKQLAAHLIKIQPPVERIFSSPYYRCLQTVQPFVQLLEQQSASPDAVVSKPAILGETGLSEWYGAAPFEHPTSAPPTELKDLFPAYDTSYVPAVTPSRTGETIAQLHERVALTLDAIIKRCDEMGIRAVLLCSHAATIIAVGRTLTGKMPANVETEDFRVFTCGLSTFRRQDTNPVRSTGVEHDSKALNWKGNGLGGGWVCEVNSDCSFLSDGEERGWRFSGDEAFLPNQRDAFQQDAGVELGVIVDGKKKPTKL